jgi:hypothetical protein
MCKKVLIVLRNLMFLLLNRIKRKRLRKPQVIIYLQIPEFFNEMTEDLTGLDRCAAAMLTKDFGAVVA